MMNAKVSGDFVARIVRAIVAVEIIIIMDMKLSAQQSSKHIISNVVYICLNR